MNKKYLVAAVGAALAVAGVSAHAVEAKISGQVNRGIMHVDDGTNSETIHVDNDASSTRFRFTGSEEIMPGVKAGIVWEMDFQSNDSNKVTPLAKGSPSTLGERKAEIYFDGSFGKLSMGQGDGAANGAVEVDLSGTTLVSYSGTPDIGGAVEFFSAGVSTGFSIGDVLNQQDFESRYDRLRYDSPKLGPVQIAVSQGHNGNPDITELAVRLDTDLGGAGKISAAAGSSTKDVGGATGDVETTGASISWLAAFGLNVTFAFSNVEDAAGTDSDLTYAKVGYKTGPHAVSVDTAIGEPATGVEGKHMGVQYVYKASKAVEIYGGYKTVSLDVTGIDADDITIALIGSRIQF